MSRHDHSTHRGTLAAYGAASLAVLAVGVVAIWSFVERQSLRGTLAPEPLPSVTVVTSDPDSELAAAWVDLLTRAQFSATLVPVERYAPADGILALAAVDALTPALRDGIRRKLEERGGVAVLGAPPPDGEELLGFAAEPGLSGETLRLAETTSPVLARVRPGYEIAFAPHDAALLEEDPSMTVDARWSGKARGAIAHQRRLGGRILFFGFDPAALWNPTDTDLGLLLRTSFRWAASQPVSEAAIGMPAASKTLTAGSRIRALESRMTWSFDRLAEDGSFVLRVRNGGPENLPNPTIKVWYPERITGLEVGGSFFARRNVTLTALDDERAAIVSLTGLRGNEDRFIQIEGRIDGAE